MIITAFDKNFKKIAPIERYSFAEYTRKYCDTGTFSMILENDEENRNIIENYKYILFGTKILGVRGMKKSQSSDWQIEGKLSQCILSSRVFETTSNFSGTPSNIAKSMVTSKFISPTNIKRKIDMLQMDPNDVPGVSMNMQVTGDEVEIALINLLDPFEIGYDLYPVLNSENTTISALKFKVYKGIDHSETNTNGNKKILFSRKLGNILTSEYSLDELTYKGMAYVAGEGEGTARKVIEVGDVNSTGLERIEMYVDARDLQSEVDGVVTPPATYEAQLLERGKENLKDHLAFETFSGTLDLNSPMFKLDKDFYLGDIISVYDEQFDTGVNARITEEKHTFNNDGEIIDLTFGKTKPLKLNILKRGGKI